MTTVKHKCANIPTADAMLYRFVLGELLCEPDLDCIQLLGVVEAGSTIATPYIRGLVYLYNDNLICSWPDWFHVMDILESIGFSLSVKYKSGSALKEFYIVSGQLLM